MKKVVTADAAQAAMSAAQWIAAALRDAVTRRGSATMAISGGATPRLMLEVLAREPLPWGQILIGQVDERLVATADPRRNLAMQRTALVTNGPLPAANLIAMPVEAPTASAMQSYAASLGQIDIAQLGLGADGHTASLLPGDAALQSRDRVALTGLYGGTRRMTLTFDAINAARQIAWLITGGAKRDALALLMAGDREIPATQVRRDGAIVFADAAAAV